MGIGGWVLPFRAKIGGIDRIPVTLAVTAAKVPVGWDQTEEIVRLRKTLQGSGAAIRLPLFLIPEIRAHLPAADLDLKIHSPRGGGDGVRLAGAQELSAIATPGEGTEFQVSGTIPDDAKSGDIFLVNVAARYAAASRVREAIVEYLEVIYVKREKAKR